jgi:hypothetical protein
MAPAPLSLLGSLSEFDSRDETPVIGTLFTRPHVQLSDILVHPNSDTLLCDLATLVSHRGVVFFKNQKLSAKQLRELGSRLGELSGKPKTSTLHKHPISESTPELGAEISVISSEGYAAASVCFYRCLKPFYVTAVSLVLTTSMAIEQATDGTLILPLNMFQPIIP